MNRKRWLLILLDILALLALGVTTVFALYNRPLGPSLELRKPAVVVQGSVTDTPSAAVAGGKKGICDGSGVQHLLLLGENLPETTMHGADAIRLGVVDYDEPAVRILSMPPELLVQISGIDDVTETSLTRAYWYGKQPPPNGEPPLVRRATTNVAQALLDNFGYDTHNYATLKEDVFVNMVKSLGGVDVYVSYAVDGSPEGYAYYPEGLNHMDGLLALNYVRMTIPVGMGHFEWDRFTRQMDVIDGLREEILSSEHWDEIPGLIQDFFHLLYTDLSPKELRSLNCMIEAVGEDITMFEVTPDMVTITPEGDMDPDEQAIRGLIAQLQGGSP